MFQSTRPVRGATSDLCLRTWRVTGFNPRAPCGARPVLFVLWSEFASLVSIHAPRAGRDKVDSAVIANLPMFQSTRPVRGATVVARLAAVPVAVSIHAPRAGRDGVVLCKARKPHAVSIHAPRAGRDVVARDLLGPRLGQFQSTRPVRGATTTMTRVNPTKDEFQSTRPVRGATCRPCGMCRQRPSFNPRAPCGARPPRVDLQGLA